MVRATSRRRAEAEILRRAAETTRALPGFGHPTTRAILETAAGRPLRGGDMPLPPGGLFDDGARAQGRLL